MGARGMTMGIGEGFAIKIFLVCIDRVIISRRLGWARHVAKMDEGRSALKILACKPTGKDF